MRALVLFLCLTMSSVVATSQTLGGHPIADYLVSATHPNGCAPHFITGPPNDSTWVNFEDGDVMTGYFGSAWTDVAGEELLLETSYNTDNYNVRLILSSGLFSSPHAVQVADWIQIADTAWLHEFVDCSIGTFGAQRQILPLDFSLHFGLDPSDIVVGIEITFLESEGAPDLAGVYIISEQDCYVNLGPDTSLCPGDSLLLDATTANATYLWQDGSTDPTYSVTQQGTYWVVVTDSCGSLSDTINIDFAPSFTINLGNDTTLCQEDSLLLDATATNATYLWQDNSTNATYEVTQPGTYWVAVTDSCGSSADTISIYYTPPLTIDLGNDTALCQGESLLLDATLIDASYLWQDGSTNPTYNVTQQGTYWVVVTDSCGSSSDTINIDYIPFPTVDLGNDTTLCPGESLLLDASTANTTFLWQDNSSDPTYNVTQPGTYWVAVTDSCGSSFDTISIYFNTSSTIDLGSDVTLCQGESLLLDATTADATYMWQDGSTNPTYSVTQQGTYSVEVRESCGSSFDTINIDYFPFLTVDLGNDTTLCPGESLLLDATTTNATYLWQDSSSNPTFSITQQGIYWVQVTDDCGISVDTINIDNALFATVDLGNDTTLCLGETLLLDATTTNGSYLWQDNSSNPTFNVTQEGTYWVEVMDCFGNTTSDRIFIESKRCDCYLDLPNIFSPNSDNINDEFLPSSNCGYSQYNLKIYNRWGEMIFESHDPEESWDGTYQGTILQTGVYVYMLIYRYNDTDSSEKIKYGDVTLIR